MNDRSGLTALALLLWRILTFLSGIICVFVALSFFRDILVRPSLTEAIRINAMATAGQAVVSTTWWDYYGYPAFLVYFFAAIGVCLFLVSTKSGFPMLTYSPSPGHFDPQAKTYSYDFVSNSYSLFWQLIGPFFIIFGYVLAATPKIGAISSIDRLAYLVLGLLSAAIGVFLLFIRLRAIVNVDTLTVTSEYRIWIILLSIPFRRDRPYSDFEAITIRRYSVSDSPRALSKLCCEICLIAKRGVPVIVHSSKYGLGLKDIPQHILEQAQLWSEATGLQIMEEET